MILVSVCDKDASELLLVASDISEIRDDAVNAGHVLFREAHAAVDDDDVVIVFEGGHVLADLSDTAQRNDLYRIGILILGVFKTVSF